MILIGFDFIKQKPSQFTFETAFVIPVLIEFQIEISISN